MVLKALFSATICLLLTTASAAFAPAAFAMSPVQLVMKTGAGDIYLELYQAQAPATVENFLKYVEAGAYNNAHFFRVVRADNQAQNNIKIEVIQGGLGDKPTPSFPPVLHESTDTTGIYHEDGTISMARNEPGTATSEFFICIGNQPELDFGGMRNPDGKGFTAFGKVARGMDIVRKIQMMKTDMPDPDNLEYTSGQILVDPVQIIQVRRLTTSEAQDIK